MKTPIHALAVGSLVFTSAAAAQSGFGVGAGAVAGLYASNCASCHGARAEGDEAQKTKSFHTDDLFHQKHDRRFYDAIRDGVAGVEGHAFGTEKGGKLKDEQCWALVAYLRELQMMDQRKRGVGAPKPQAGGVYSSSQHKYVVETVIDGGITTPWSVAFLPDGRMLVTEKPGRVRVHSTGKPGGSLSEPVAGIPAVHDRGQGGLMDVAVHPKFAENGWVFLAYSDPKGQPGGRRTPAMTKIVRGKISGEGANLSWTDQTTIFEAREDDYLASDLHYGCRIVFDPADPTTLFFSIGERGQGPDAQNLALPNGKVHRVKDDGTIPADNPFNTDDDKSKNAYATIWSYGHRNPQGLAFDLAGNLWDSEHGPRGGDELNFVQKGHNYGWPVISYGINYPGSPYRTPWSEGDRFDMPVFRWLPAVGQCGLDVVRPGTAGEAFPKWKGDFVAGSLSGNAIDRIRVKGDAKGGFEFVEREELIYKLGRVRDVVCGPDGTIYACTNDPDKVIRLVPAPDSN